MFGFQKFLGNYIGGLEVLDFSGIEQVTDEVFFILNREGIAGNIKEIVCTGCVHITDFGISLLVKACPNLEQVSSILIYNNKINDTYDNLRISINNKSNN